MIVTIWCITVVLISIVLVGVPLSWLLNRRKWTGEQAWLEAPFLGIAAIILILQNLVYLNLPIRYTAPLIWVGVIAGWLWMYQSGQIGAVFATFPRALFAIALAVYLLQGMGLLIVGTRFYMGRAWGDQYNYTVLAQFLTDEHFNMSMSEVGNRPYLVNAVKFKSDRIGQSILHSFFTTSSLQNAKTLFEPTILLAPALIVLAIYALARRSGLQKPYALAAGATAGLLPGIATVHLESFLSQALAIPLLLFSPVLLDDLIAQSNWRRVSACAIIAAAITSIYTEFWIILVGLTALMLGVMALGTVRARRLLGYGGILALAPFALNPFFAVSTLAIFNRLGEPVLGRLYPWALSIEGLARLWIGDLAAAPQPLLSLVYVYALAATVLGYYGLVRMCRERLPVGRMSWAEYRQRRALAFALGVLALALLPVVIIARDRQHPYQFYKVLLSISPLLILGLTLAMQPYLPDAPITPQQASILPSTSMPFRRSVHLSGVLALLLLGATLAGNIAGTAVMVLESTRLKPTERYNGYYLIAPEMQQLQEHLESLRDEKLFYFEVDSTWDTGFVNAWLAYFARHNQIWLGNPHLNGLDLSSIPETKSIVELKAIPRDVLVLRRADTRNVALPTQQTLLWSNSSYQLWKSDTASWIVPLQFKNLNGLEAVNGQPFFWLGRGDTAMRLLVGKSGQLRMTATFVLGPSAPALIARRVLLTTDHGYRQEVVLEGGIHSIVLPVESGAMTITLQPLDQPTVTKQRNGDTRPLLLGVQGLRLELEP